MANYIEVQNDSGVVQINDSFNNLILLRKFTIADWQKINNTWNADIVIPEYPATLFIHNPRNELVELFFAIAAPDGGRLSRHIYVNTTSGNKPSDLEFFIFGIGIEQPSDSNGLQVYNEDGVCIFSSHRKYLNIVRTIKPINGDYETQERVTLKAGIKHAVCMTVPTVHFVGNGGLSHRWDEVFMRLGPQTAYVEFKWGNLLRAPNDDDFDYDEYTGVSPIWLDANVTGY